MLTVGFAQLKPGTTKTTSAVYTSAGLHAMDLHVLLVDADPARSATRWSSYVDDRFPWPVVQVTTGRELRAQIARHKPDAVVVDLPQMEDHARINTELLPELRHWIMPTAPAGIELDRAAHVHQAMDKINAHTSGDVLRWALLTRTNKPWRTLRGSDQAAAQLLSGDPFRMRVFADQVPASDRFRDQFGAVPDARRTPYWRVARVLLGKASPDTCAYCETMQACHHPRPDGDR